MDILMCSPKEADFAFDSCYQAAFDSGKSEWFNQLSCDSKEILKQVHPWRFYECYCCHSPCRIFDFIGKDGEISTIKLVRFNMETNILEIPIVKTFDEISKFIYPVESYGNKTLRSLEDIGDIGYSLKYEPGWDRFNRHVDALINPGQFVEKIYENRRLGLFNSPTPQNIQTNLFSDDLNATVLSNIPNKDEKDHISDHITLQMSIDAVRNIYKYGVDYNA